MTVGKSVRLIGDGAFNWCANLRQMHFWGHAPEFEYDEDEDLIFHCTENLTVYYLPGTYNWSLYSGHFPTMEPWVLPYPVILAFAPGFGTENNQFGFTISWATNASVVVEAARNLNASDWGPVAIRSLSNGTSYFTDPAAANHPSRFYRVRKL